jgi:hypothetical protein
VSLKMRQIGRDLGDLSLSLDSGVRGEKMLKEINDAHLAFVVNTYGYFIFSIISYINGKSSCVLCELKEAY